MRKVTTACAVKLATEYKEEGKVKGRGMEGEGEGKGNGMEWKGMEGNVKVKGR
jgi:hypothetical protein